MSRYEDTFFSYFDAIKNLLKVQPIVLGGSSGSNGGSGGPPGGFIGYLPQTRVAYDTTEAETYAVPFSGATLVDNLNHIRKRISDIYALGSGVSFLNDGIGINDGVTQINILTPLRVTSTGASSVTIAYSGDVQTSWYSGVWNEKYTANGVSSTFTTAKSIFDASVRVFLNGVRENPAGITILGDKTGFQLGSPPASGTVVVVDYETPVATPGHAHNEYRLISDSYSQAETDLYFSPAIHTHTEDDITDLDHNAVKILGISISGGLPLDGQVLQYQSDTNTWESVTIVGLSTQTIKQQLLISLAGTLESTGVSPLGVAMHDVDAEIDEVYIKLFSAPSTTALQLDILKNSSSILSSPVTIGVGVTSVTVSTGFTDTSLAKNDYLQLQLIQGDADASYLTAHVRFSWDL